MVEIALNAVTWLSSSAHQIGGSGARIADRLPRTLRLGNERVLASRPPWLSRSTLPAAGECRIVVLWCGGREVQRHSSSSSDHAEGGRTLAEQVIERHDDLCDVPGILVGSDSLLDAGTGCTVVLPQWPALGAVDVRGGAPATRETDLLSPVCFMREVHAILLAGGSAFGLAAADGVMRALAERGIGFDTGVARVPIVPAAALFDLGLGQHDMWPDADAGRRAVAATTGGPVAQGSVGAGTGATVGKLAGPAFAIKGGLGSASAKLPDGHTLGALVVVNAAGDIYDPATGQIVAGARDPSGHGWRGDQPQEMSGVSSVAPGTNTTLAVIATDAPFAKAELSKLAQMAHDGLALAIRPTHTPLDGDVVFALCTAREPAPPVQPGWQVALAYAGAIAAQVTARAILKAVRAATGLHGVPAVSELPA
jgi:L-aminopeptidase/D-esterase-like protein